MAVAGVGVAPVSEGGRGAPLQRHAGQPLLGADVCVLPQQVNPTLPAILVIRKANSDSHLCIFNSNLLLLLLRPRCRFGSDPTVYVVRVGASEQTLTPERLVLHRKFKGQSGGHDLALLKLPSTKGHCLTFEPNTNAACLPGADGAEEGNLPASCVVMVTTGWGGPGKNRTETCLKFIGKVQTKYYKLFFYFIFLNKINEKHFN